MKIKNIVCIIVCLFFGIGFIGFILWNNRTISTITLDINPSIKIHLDKNEKVKNIIALNIDASKVISDNIKGKSLEETFKLLITNLSKEGYVDDNNNIDVILYVDGNIKSEEVAKKIEFEFGKKNVHAEILFIDKITKDDEKLAKKYNISPAKLAYIRTLKDENKSIDVEDMANKPVSELIEIENTGNYCDKDYILEGDWCLKEVNRVKASTGEICPIGYYEYNGKCYLEGGLEETNELICREGFTLRGKKCENVIQVDAVPSKYTCSKGEAKTRLELKQASINDGNANEIVCVDYSSATHPVSPCETNDGTEYTVSGGKCYWHRAPVIDTGCPGKIQIGDMCWDDASNILICEGYRDGKQYTSRSEYCENSINYITPTITEYKCEKDFTLKGTKCEKIEIEDAWYKTECKSGYSEVDNDRCINENDTVNKVDGYVCNMENSKVVGKYCVIYEKIEAKHN